MSFIQPTYSKLRGSLIMTVACMACMAMLICSSCVNEDLGNEPARPDGPDGNELFMYVNVELPTGTSTRSETESEGGSSGDSDNDFKTEDGFTNENTLSSVELHFFEINGNYLETITGFVATPNGNGNVTLKAKVSPSKLLNLSGKETKLFIVANNGSHTFTNISGVQSATFQATDLEAEPLGKFTYSDDGENKLGNVVPIGNKSEVIVDFSDLEGNTEGDILKNLEKVIGYDDKNRSLNLSEVKKKDDTESSAPGRINLERGVARVDFKPNHVLKPNSTDDYYKANLYPVGKIPNLYAEMVSLQVFNVSKESFLFRHTSAGNKTTGYPSSENLDGYTGGLFGTERGTAYGTVASTTTNPDGTTTTVYYEDYYWITDTDWKTKDDKATTGPDAAYFLNQPALVSDINGLTGYYTFASGDTKGIMELSGKTAGDWYPWCYITENTLPSTAAMTKGLCTGVAFRMFLCKETGTPITPDDFITREKYLEASKELADEEAKDEPNQTVIDKNEAILAKVVGELTQVGNSEYYRLVIGSDDCYAEKVTELNSEGQNVDKYYITYWYFFRHNLPTPHVVGTVEPMQFAVVRNNIYKISVTSLNGLPEPFKPGDPAEPQEEYISVELNILSWAREDREWEL